MYAIVEIAGQQVKVSNNAKVIVNRLEGEVGASLSFNEVLLVDNDTDVKVGTPVVSGANVSAKIVSHLRADKVLVFKKKRRKSYQKMNGHRQDLTELVIENINA